MYRRHTQHLCEDSTRAPLHTQQQTLQEDYDWVIHRKNHFINALLNQTNAVILSDTSHTILGAAKSDSDFDDNEIFVKDRPKKKNTLSPGLGVIDDN